MWVSLTHGNQVTEYYLVWAFASVSSMCFVYLVPEGKEAQNPSNPAIHDVWLEFGWVVLRLKLLMDKALQKLKCTRSKHWCTMPSQFAVHQWKVTSKKCSAVPLNKWVCTSETLARLTKAKHSWCCKATRQIYKVRVKSWVNGFGVEC